MKKVLNQTKSGSRMMRRLFGIFILSLPLTVSAQFSIIHTPPPNLEKSGASSIQFKAPGIQADQVLEAYALVWFDTDPNKVRKPATLKDDVFTIDLDFTGTTSSSVMYSFFLEMSGGTTISFPENDPQNNPVTVALTEPQVTDKKRDGRVGKIDFTVLSPEPGGSVNPADLVVAITLFYKEGDATPEGFQLKIDGKDVTSEAQISPYFISWVPKEPPKDGTVSVDLSVKNEKGRSVSLVNFKSKVSQKVQPDQVASAGKGSIVGNGELAARNQSIAGSNQDIYRGNFNLNARYGGIRFAANGLATSLENARLQPQNRYAAELYLGNWFEVQAGHIYPVTNSLILNGRRIYGVNAGLYLFKRNIGFQALYGEMNRRVDNLYTNVAYTPSYTILTSGDTLKDSNTGMPVVTPGFELGNQAEGLGTYKRKVWGGRFNIGNGRLFGFGISALKVEDDTTSIVNFKNYNSIPASYLSSLTVDQRSQLAANPDLLAITAANPQAKGNFMAAADLTINANKGRFRINADAAVNLLNEDIGEGVLNKERADELGFELEDDLSDILDQLSAIIVINENMKAFPIRFKETSPGSGEWETEVFVPKGIFAGQATLSMNYFNNNISAQYMWMGPDFTPLSNTAVRRDIAGFSVSDRIRMFRNRVYLSGGYEVFQDNLLNTLEATTTTTSTRAGIGWYPFKTYLPRINLNFRLQNRDNGFRAVNSLLNDSLRTRAVRSILRVNPDSTTLLPNARFSDTYQYSATITQQFSVLGTLQDLTVGYTLVDTKDREFYYGNYTSNIYNGSLSTRWNGIPLKTTAGVTLNFTEALSGLNSIDIYGYSLGGELLLMQDKLQINGDLALAYNTIRNVDLTVLDGLNTPSEVLDDYFAPNYAAQTETKTVSYIVNASARYNINKYHAFAVLFSYTSVKNKLDSTAIPNDQILQARYIISF